MVADRPDRAYIEALVTWAGGTMSSAGVDGVRSGGGVWGQFYQRVAREMTFHRLEFAGEVIGEGGEIPYFPKNFRILLPATGPSKVRAAINQVFVGDPQVKVETPKGYRSEANRKAIEDKLTKLAQQWIQTDERQGDSAPLVLSKINCIAYGCGALQTTWKRDAYPKDPVRKKGESQTDWEKRQAEHAAICDEVDPFETKSLHPTQFAYDRSHNPPRWAVTWESITPWEAAEEYPYYAQQTGQSAIPAGATGNVQSSLTKVWYWTPEWCACYIDGTPAFGPGQTKGAYKADEEGVAKNPYGFIPIDFAPGGHGDQDPDNRPEYELVGIYKGLVDLLIAEASCFTLEEIYRQQTSYGNKVVIRAATQAIADQIEAQLRSGPNVHVKVVGTDASVTQLDLPALPVALTDQRNRLEKDIDRASVYDIAAGSGGPTEAARRTALRLVQTDKQVAQAATNIEQMLENNIRKRIKMLKTLHGKRVGYKVSMRGQAAEYVDLDPAGIPDVFTVTVRLIGETDEQKQIRSEMGMSRLGTTLDTETYLRDYADEKDPEAIMTGLLNDEAFQTVIKPAYIQALQGEIPAILAEVAAEQGIIMSNEELQAALPPPPQPMGMPMQPMAPEAQPVGGVPFRAMGG